MLIAGLMMPTALLLMTYGGGAATALQAAAPSSANAWQIGPIIRGRNYSVGMPLQPTPARRGWHIDFPYPDVRAGHVHYITFNHGPLVGKRRIVVRYRVDAAPGVRFMSRESPENPATISLFFQRRGDSWSARGRYEHYRWYAPVHTVAQIRRGEHQMIVSLDDNWGSVMGAAAAANPQAYREAIADTERVGIVLGWAGGRGHGVYATGPARLTVTSFQII